MTYLLPITCRFCMNSNSEDLLDLHKVDCEINLIIILNNFNFKVNLNDGLPSLLCRNCLDIIRKFHEFRQRCLEVEKNLKIEIFSPSSSSQANLITCAFDTTIKYEEIQKLQSSNMTCTEQDELKNTLSPLSIKLLSDRKKYNKTSQIHQCETCGKVFKGLKTLKNHIITHCGLKQFSCQICSKNFARKENLNIHMRSHLGIRPYICDICGKSSIKRQDLIRHLKIHSQDRDYVCTRCNCTFKRSSDVIRHMRTHTGERPYSCRECNKNYTSHSGLRKHLKIHNNLLLTTIKV